MQTQIHSLDSLKKALSKTPENVKAIFTGIVGWFKSVKDETPAHLKNAAKIIHLIFQERQALAKRKALGLDAGLNRVEYAAKYLGNKPNRRMLSLATAFALVNEEVFDKAEVWMLQRLGTMAERTGKPSLKDALRDAKAALVKNDTKAFTAICERVVPCTENDKAWEYLTEEQFKTYAANTQKAESVSAARVLSLDQLLSVGVAEVIANDKMDADTAKKAEAHLTRLLDELRKKTGKATTANVVSLKKAMENHVAA